MEELCIAAAEIVLRGLAGMRRRAATSSERSGTMQKAMPVETVWTGWLGSRSSTLSRGLWLTLCGLREWLRDGVFLLHGAEDATLTGLRRRETDGDAAYAEIEDDLRCTFERGVVPVEPACGAECGVTGELEFFLHR